MAPGILGQLHVLELDNDVFESNDVKAFKHYKVIRFPFVANNNPRCREVHRSDCKFLNLMKTEHKVGYWSLSKAIKDGYNGCHFCIGGELDKR
jgi:isopenicillin N synthase-like dioxygenase